MVQIENSLRLCEVQVTYTPDYKISERPKITSSLETYQLLKQEWDKGRINFLEEFKVILLNRANRVLGLADISIGGVSGTVVDPKIVFATALKGNCSSIIVAHNHPSGNLRPSESDIRLTKKLVECGKLLEIVVFDHVIITEYGYYSFLDEGMI
ncbi:DNA repair protein [Pedobacter changchengzhani]|uniref:DNA repair protein n=1 Tax=Pedobacter changchengzhani TaxID=2529274 RepID=A0A4R5MKQ4_9SPHI|nr:JAB domain-containing protein [Pedobacter changchengzhani]TDG36254.1 DNA repair protein [Pedobacter changchengzhani]